MKYQLCADLLRKYQSDEIVELVCSYTDSEADCKEMQQTIENLNMQIVILEAENRFLKEEQ